MDTTTLPAYLEGAVFPDTDDLPETLTLTYEDARDLTEHMTDAARFTAERVRTPVLTELEDRWYNWSSCSGLDSNLFYTEAADPIPRRAQAACAACPVKKLCARAVIEDPAACCYGTYAGVRIAANPSHESASVKKVAAMYGTLPDPVEKVSEHIDIAAALIHLLEDKDLVRSLTGALSIPPRIVDSVLNAYDHYVFITTRLEGIIVPRTPSPRKVSHRD